MNDSQADIAASLRTIKFLLVFIIGMLFGLASRLAGLTEVIPSWVFFTVFVVCYFWFHWREAMKQVDADDKRAKENEAKWARYDREVEEFREREEYCKLNGLPAPRWNWVE